MVAEPDVLSVRSVRPNPMRLNVVVVRTVHQFIRVQGHEVCCDGAALMEVRSSLSPIISTARTITGVRN